MTKSQIIFQKKNSLNSYLITRYYFECDCTKNLVLIDQEKQKIEEAIDIKLVDQACHKKRTKNYL